MIFLVCKGAYRITKLTQNICLTVMKNKICGSFALRSATSFMQFNKKHYVYYVCISLLHFRYDMKTSGNPYFNRLFIWEHSNRYLYHLKSLRFYVKISDCWLFQFFCQ